LQEHKEYWPLISRRAHSLGGHAAIEDTGLRAAWAAFLAAVARRPTPTSADRLKAAVFLLAQVSCAVLQEACQDNSSQSAGMCPPILVGPACWPLHSWMPDALCFQG